MVREAESRPALEDGRDGDERATTDERPTTTARPSPALAVSNEMVRLLSRYTGRGPTKARTTLSTNVVVVTFQDVLTKAEQTLAAAGQIEAVKAMRSTFHQLMREEASERIGRILGRPVTACLSDVDPTANVAAMVFILDSEAESGRVDVKDSQPGPHVIR